jgi:hypothetical protein
VDDDPLVMVGAGGGGVRLGLEAAGVGGGGRASFVFYMEGTILRPES